MKMKKLLVIAATLLAISSAHALDAGISSVHDYRSGTYGTRVTVSSQPVATPVGQITPQLSVTSVNDAYTRFSVGGTTNVATVGPATVYVSGAGVYQDSVKGVGGSGYGLSVGSGVSVPLTKSVNLTAGVERFWGQQRVGYNSNQFVVGLNTKF